MKISIYPGSMGACGLAIDIFGIDRVNPESWATPIYVNDVSQEEIDIAKELLEEYNLNIDILE